MRQVTCELKACESNLGEVVAEPECRSRHVSVEHPSLMAELESSNNPQENSETLLYPTASKRGPSVIKTLALEPVANLYP